MEKGTRVRVKQIEDMPDLNLEVVRDPRGKEGVVTYVYEDATLNIEVEIDTDGDDEGELDYPDLFTEDELEVIE